MSAGERWTDEAVILEFERWVYVPPDGVHLEDERRLLLHLPKRWGQSRVWRSSAPDEEKACELIGETIGAVRAFGGGRLVWHTGEGLSPPFMDECLARLGFETSEELHVLAFSLVDGQRSRLPRLGFHEVGEPNEEGASLALRFLAFSDVGSEHGGEDIRKAMGAAGAQLVGETLRLWGAATRKAFRGRGAYGALVLERCRVGIELGATLALTKANIATSGPTLERAGFRVVATERRHALEVS